MGISFGDLKMWGWLGGGGTEDIEKGEKNPKGGPTGPPGFCKKKHKFSFFFLKRKPENEKAKKKKKGGGGGGGDPKRMEEKKKRGTNFLFRGCGGGKGRRGLASRAKGKNILGVLNGG